MPPATAVVVVVDWDREATSGAIAGAAACVGVVSLDVLARGGETFLPLCELRNVDGTEEEEVVVGGGAGEDLAESVVGLVALFRV